MYSSEVTKYHNLNIIERIEYIENLVETFRDIKDFPSLLKDLHEVKEALPNLLRKDKDTTITAFWKFSPETKEKRPGLLNFDGTVSKFLIEGEGGKFEPEDDYNVSGQWTFSNKRPKFEYEKGKYKNFLIKGEEGSGFNPEASYDNITGSWRFNPLIGNNIIFDKKPLFHVSDSEGNLEFLVKGDEGTFDSESDYTIQGMWVYSPKRDNHFYFLSNLPLYRPNTTYAGDYFLAAGDLGPENDGSWNIKGKWTFSDSNSMRPGIGKGSNFKKFLVEGEGGGGSGFDPSDDNIIYGSWTFNPKKVITFYGKKPVFKISETEFGEPSELITQNDLNTEITKINNKITDIVNKLPDKTQTTTIDGAWVFDSNTPIVFKVPPVVKSDVQNEEGSPLITQKVFNNRLSEIVNTIADKGGAATISGKWTFTGERPGYNSVDGFKEFLIKGEGGGGGGDFDPSKSYNITNTWYYSNIPYLRVKKPETQTEEYIDYSFLTTNSTPVIESKWKFNEYPEVKVGEDQGKPVYKPVLTDSGVWTAVGVLGGLIVGGIITFGVTDKILAYRNKKIAAVETTRDFLPATLSINDTYTKFCSFNSNLDEYYTGASILEGCYYYDQVYQIMRRPVAIDTYSTRYRNPQTQEYDYYYFLNLGASKKHDEGKLLVNRHLTPFEYCVSSTNGERKKYIHQIIIGDESNTDSTFPTEVTEFAAGLYIRYNKLLKEGIGENFNYFDSELTLCGLAGDFTDKNETNTFSRIYMQGLYCSREIYNYHKLQDLNFASSNKQTVTLGRILTQRKTEDEYDVSVNFEGFTTELNPENIRINASEANATQYFKIPNLEIGKYSFSYLTTQGEGEHAVDLYTKTSKETLQSFYEDAKTSNQGKITNISKFISLFGHYNKSTWVTDHVDFRAHSFSLTDTSKLESLKAEEPTYTDIEFENNISKFEINPTVESRKTTCTDYYSKLEFTEIPADEHLIIPHVKKYVSRLSRLIPPKTPYSSLLKFSAVALNFEDEYEKEESDLTITLGKFEGTGPGEKDGSLWEAEAKSFFNKLSNEKTITNTFSDIRFKGCFDNLPYVERIDHNPTTGIISFAVIPNPCCVPSLDPRAFTSGHVIYASTYDTNVCDPSKPTTVEITADVVKIPMRTGIGNYSAEGLKDIANIPENIASVGFLNYMLDPVKADIIAVRSLSQYSAALSTIGAAGSAVMAATKLVSGTPDAGSIGALAQSFSIPKPPDAPGTGDFIEEFSEFEIENLELKKSFISNSIGSQITSASLSHGNSFLEASTGSWIGDISTIIEENKNKYKINTEKWGCVCGYGNPPGLNKFSDDAYTFAVNSNIYFGGVAVGKNGHTEANKFLCYAPSKYYGSSYFSLKENVNFDVVENNPELEDKPLVNFSVDGSKFWRKIISYGNLNFSGYDDSEEAKGIYWNDNDKELGYIDLNKSANLLTIKAKGESGYQSTLILSGKEREESKAEISLNTNGNISLMANDGIEVYNPIIPQTGEIIKKTSSDKLYSHNLTFNQRSVVLEGLSNDANNFNANIQVWALNARIKLETSDSMGYNSHLELSGATGNIKLDASGEIVFNKEPIIITDRNNTKLATEEYVNKNSIVKIDGKTKESINEKVVLIRDTMNDGTTQYFLAIENNGKLCLLNDSKYMSEFITRAGIN